MGIHPRTTWRQRVAARRMWSGSGHVGKQGERCVSYCRLEAHGEALGRTQAQHIHDIREAESVTEVNTPLRPIFYSKYHRLNGSSIPVNCDTSFLWESETFWLFREILNRQIWWWEIKICTTILYRGTYQHITWYSACTMWRFSMCLWELEI